MSSNPCKYHSWYHQNWNTDGFVVESDYETIGVYILLLHRQMVEGDIPSNIDRLVGQVGHRITKEKFLEIWEERGLKYQFKEVRRLWESKPPPSGRASDPKIDGVWRDLPEPRLDRDASPRLHQEFLHQVMENDRRITQSRVKGGETSQTNRFTVQSSLEASLEEATPTFDFKPIMRLMPKRVKKGKKGWDGWDAGVDLLKFVTTQEEYDDLLAATQAYAKERRGEDAAYHIGFHNWVKGEYRKHVPEGKQPAKQAAPEEPKVEVVYASTEEKIKALRAQGHAIAAPPWTPRPFYSKEEQDEVAARWTEAKRVNWLTKYLENPNG